MTIEEYSIDYWAIQKSYNDSDRKVFWKYVNSQQRPHALCGPLGNPPNVKLAMIHENAQNLLLDENLNVPCWPTLTSTS